jgi:16S rRNA (uracil1498-N3)-methyltransferase
MRLHRFVLGVNLLPGRLQIDDSDVVHQWSKVLRLREGDTVVLCDGKGSQAHAVLHELGKKAAVVIVDQVEKVTAEPKHRVTLCAAIVKRENFEWIVEKATETGVTEIIPIITDRTMKTGLKMERLQAIAKEAVEQCGRGVVPVIREPTEFSDAWKNATGRQVFLHLDGNESTARHDGDVTIWIGPEGGWTESEADFAKKNGAEMRSLGALTLRAETACVVATYLAANGSL